MKKTFITSTCILFLFAAFAQKTTLGISAGTTISNFKSKDGGVSASLDSKVGFTGGLIANISAGQHFIVQSGLQIVQKGTKYTRSEGGSTLKSSTNTNWLEVPVNFLYNSNGFFIGAGPSFSFGVSGKSKIELDGEKTTEKMKFGNSDDDDIKGFDFGANVMTGYQLNNGLLIAANFNQGFSNLMPGSSDNGSIKSHYFGIRLGYMFKGKK